MVIGSTALRSDRASQREDIKNDRVSVGIRDEAPFDSDELEDLEDLVISDATTGDVTVADIVMCAKCIGECKIF